MVLGQLKEKADLVAETFNSLEGMSCNPVQGAMYAFPQIKMPQAAIEAAKVITVGLQISGCQISRFFSLLTIFFGNRFFYVILSLIRNSTFWIQMVCFYHKTLFNYKFDDTQLNTIERLMPVNLVSHLFRFKTLLISRPFLFLRRM